MSVYKASIYNYIFNSINVILVIVNGIIMVPVYFNYMSVSTYGAWLATGNVVVMLGLLESGFAGVITQRMSAAIAQKNDTRFSLLAGANILSAIAISLVILLVGLGLAPFVTDWINVDPEVIPDIRIAFIISLIATCVQLLVSLFGVFPQVWQDTKPVGIFNTVANLLAIASLVVFLIAGCGVVSIALSYLVRSSFNLILYDQWIIRKWKRCHYPSPVYSYYEVLSLSKDCFYPFLSKISGTVVANSQSFIIAHFMNPALSTVYDLTSKICMVACSFVSMMNGSFFALFSLTLAGDDKEKVDNVMKTSNTFFFTLLSVTLLYSICFTEPVMYYWVGLDKFGGTWLLIAIVVAKILLQMRAYFNNVLYSGGYIGKSAKFDILWMFTYVSLLLALIKSAQIYAVPVATFVSCLLFVGVYVYMMNKYLKLNTRSIIYTLIKTIAVVLPFCAIHFLVSPNYANVMLYAIYVFLFSVTFIVVLYITNRQFFRLIIKRFVNR